MSVADKTHFTKSLLDGLPLPPDGKRATYFDDQVRGLCVIVMPSGKRSFYVLRKVRGRPERVLIGRYPETTIAQARKRGGEINSLLDAGENPNDVRREQRREPTLNAFYELYYSRHVLQRNRRPEESRYKYLRYVAPYFGTRHLSEITRRDIVAWQLVLSEKFSKESSNRGHTLLRAILNKAVSWDVLQGMNPANGLERFRSKSRDRFITAAEMPRFLSALAEEPNETIRDYIYVLLFTGARRREASAMRWQDVDMDSAVWRIPETKNGEPRRVAISKACMEILRRRRVDAKTDWVFPGAGKSGHLEEPKKAWARILANAEIQDLHLHDLRRTHGSWLAAGGTSLHVIGKALGHKDVKTTTIYARLDLEPVRHAVEQATDAMLKHG